MRKIVPYALIVAALLLTTGCARQAEADSGLEAELEFEQEASDCDPRFAPRVVVPEEERRSEDGVSSGIGSGHAPDC